MKWLPSKIRKRIESAEKAARHNEARNQQVQQQWPEVRELSGWAREARATNHLTELFINGLHRKGA